MQRRRQIVFQGLNISSELGPLGSTSTVVADESPRNTAGKAVISIFHRIDLITIAIGLSVSLSLGKGHRVTYFFWQASRGRQSDINEVFHIFIKNIDAQGVRLIWHTQISCAPSQAILPKLVHRSSLGTVLYPNCIRSKTH